MCELAFWGLVIYFCILYVGQFSSFVLCENTANKAVQTENRHSGHVTLSSSQQCFVGVQKKKYFYISLFSSTAHFTDKDQNPGVNPDVLCLHCL